MGLFRPLDESIHDLVNQNAATKHGANIVQRAAASTGADKKNIQKASNAAGIKKGDGAMLQIHKMNKLSQQHGGPNITKGMSKNRDFQKSLHGKTEDRYGESRFASGHVKHESTFALLGLTDEEIQAFEEGCNSDTCKCKGGTCPVKTTDGISTSSAAAKKLATAGHNNQTDLFAVTPNAEYNQQNDARFIGDGDSPETSRTNIPAILAAKTAGGSPHEETVKNGINAISTNIFKVKMTKDDPDGY